MQYAAAFGRMMVMKSTLLKKEHFDRLCKAESFDAAVGMLSRSPYKEAAEKSVHAPLSILEHNIKELAISDFKKLIKFIPEEIADIAKLWFCRHELANIKTAVRAFRENVALNDVNHLFLDLQGTGFLNFDRFMACQSLGDLQNLVAHGKDHLKKPYSDLFRKVMPFIKEGEDLRFFEQALDINYEKTYWQELSKLTSRDHDFTERYLVRVRDLSNLLWFARFKINLNRPVREILSFLSEDFVKTHTKLIEKLGECKTIAEIIKILIPDYFKTKDLDRAGFEQTPNTMAEFETLINRSKRLETKSYFAWQKFCMGSFLAYFDLRDFEINDIITVLAGKHMAFPAEAITKRLTIAA